MTSVGISDAPSYGTEDAITDHVAAEHQARLDNVKQQIRTKMRQEYRFARIEQRSTRKGFIVLIGLLAIASWFLYYNVLNRNKKLFFMLVLVGLVVGGVAFFGMVQNGGSIGAQKFI